MKIGIIGSTGLVGSRVIELLKNSYDFSEFNSSTGTDITEPNTLINLAQSSEIQWVILLAAKTDVDGCELDRELGENGDAWRINVSGPNNVAQVCRENGKKLIYISTDFVFDGTKPEEESYTEEDTPNPINWYGYTKWKGEQAVIESGAEYVIVRLAYPYRADFEKKKDFMRAIKDRLGSGQIVSGVSDHVFSPTYIDDFVNALDMLIQQNVLGIYHVVGSMSLTPFEAVQTIAKEFDFDISHVKSTTREQFFAGKADRPFNLAMNNDKINALGVHMKTFEEGLQEIKHQITNSK